MLYQYKSAHTDCRGEARTNAQHLAKGAHAAAHARQRELRGASSLAAEERLPAACRPDEDHEMRSDRETVAPAEARAACAGDCTRLRRCLSLTLGVVSESSAGLRACFTCVARTKVRILTQKARGGAPQVREQRGAQSHVALSLARARAAALAAAAAASSRTEGSGVSVFVLFVLVSKYTERRLYW